MKKKILIIGTSASKEPFERKNNLYSSFEVVNFFENNSLATFADLKNNKDVPNEINEALQSEKYSVEEKQQLNNWLDEYQQNAIQILKKNEFDVLILDFATEQFELAVYHDKTISLTNSIKEITSEYEKINFVDSKDRVKLFQQGFEHILSILRDNNALDKLYIHDVSQQFTPSISEVENISDYYKTIKATYPELQYISTPEQEQLDNQDTTYLHDEYNAAVFNFFKNKFDVQFFIATAHRKILAIAFDDFALVQVDLNFDTTQYAALEIEKSGHACSLFFKYQSYRYFVKNLSADFKVNAALLPNQDFALLKDNYFFSVKQQHGFLSARSEREDFKFSIGQKLQGWELFKIISLS